VVAVSSHGRHSPPVSWATQFWIDALQEVQVVDVMIGKANGRDEQIATKDSQLRSTLPRFCSIAWLALVRTAPAYRNPSISVAIASIS
jgi:hypothetical protein